MKNQKRPLELIFGISKKFFLALTVMVGHFAFANLDLEDEENLMQYLTNNPQALKLLVSDTAECRGELSVQFGGHFGSNKLDRCTPEIAHLMAMEKCLNSGLHYCRVYEAVTSCRYEIVSSYLGGNFGTKARICTALYRGLRELQ